MSKVILITGTRKGIGLELAKYYCSKGHSVIGCSRSEAVVNTKNYEHYCLDICDEKSVSRMVKAIKKSHGKIDVLINNAGIASMNHLLMTPTKTAQDIINTNFIGTFLLTREVAKAMMKSKQGRIVNYSTVAAAFKLEGEAIYAASKAAVENFTQTAAKELAAYGITINTIAPTPVETDLIKAVPKDKIQALLDRQAIKRFGTIDDISNVIDFYIDDKSSFITGQTLYLGGVSN